MNKIEILDAKIDFCRNMLEYKKCIESNHKAVSDITEIINDLKRHGVFKDINFNRSDAIMHNKLIETIKEFKKQNVDPCFFYDKPSDDYFLANFYTSYILLYLSDIILAIHIYLSKIVDELSFMAKDMEKLTKHFIRIVIKSLLGGNMILEDSKCQERIKNINEAYQGYQDKLDELYAFDVRKDYLKIANMILDRVFIEENKGRLNFDEAILIQYNIDTEFLTKMDREEDLPVLKELYTKRLNEYGMDTSILDGEKELYFSKILPETEEIFEYTKLNSEELAKLFTELEWQKFTSIISGGLTGNAPKDVANLMQVANQLEEVKGPEKKLK